MYILALVFGSICRFQGVDLEEAVKCSNVKKKTQVNHLHEHLFIILLPNS
jgi:hypothetical protein